MAVLVVCWFKCRGYLLIPVIVSELTGAVDFLAAVERLWVVVAAIASFLVNVNYKFGGVHHHIIVIHLV